MTGESTIVQRQSNHKALRKRFAATVLLVPLFLLLSGCGESIREDDILARIDGEPVTRESFQQWLEAGNRGFHPDNAEQRLEEFIAFRVRLSEAKSRGLHEDPAMRHRFDRILAAAVERDLKENKAPPEPPSESDLREMYQDSRDDFRIPARARAAKIFVEAPHDMASERRAERRETLERARREVETWSGSEHPDHFGELAVRHSHHHASRHRGGDLGWWREDDDFPEWDSSIPETVFALETPGELSPVIETDNGFYLFRLVERDEARYRDFDSVRPRLARRAVREARNEAAELRERELRERHPVKVYPERLDSIAGTLDDDPSP